MQANQKTKLFQIIINILQIHNVLQENQQISTRTNWINKKITFVLNDK